MTDHQVRARLAAPPQIKKAAQNRAAFPCCVHEETGLTVTVGEVALVNEFHDPDRPFHQVDVYFRCTLVAGDPDADWTDPEGVVTERHWLTRDSLANHRFKPDSLPDVAWGPSDVPAFYDPLEPLVR